MEKTALAAALAVFLCAGAQAQHIALPVSVELAHQHLARTLSKYQVKYLVWYGPGTHDYYKGHAEYYSGSGCMSEFGSDPQTRAFGVDWSKISSVRGGGTIVYAGGELVRASSGRRLHGFHLYLADSRSAASVENALNALRAACAERSIFDVASR